MNLEAIRYSAGNRRLFLLLAAVSVLAIAAIACTSNADPTAEPSATQNTVGNGSQVNLNTGPETSGFSGVPSFSSGDSRGISASNISPVYFGDQAGQTGIWVTGYGSKEVASDVAKVYLGVESKEETVSEARQNAAEAMTAVLDAIKALGVSSDDIVTTSFNIYPQQVWIEVNDSIGRHSEPRITGYIVSNTVEVTVRDIDKLDEVIDAAAEQGGDLIRVNSISFTVASPAQYSAETRQLAAADAKAKAQLYADAMGVTLGPLVFLTETSSSAPLATRAASADGAYAEAAFAPTPIESGEVNLSTTIQAAFAIVP